MIFVKFFKVSRDDRDGQGEDEDPGHCTHAPEQLAQPSGGGDVTVTHRGHRHHHPVDPSGDGGEAGGGADLNEVGEGGEYQAADGDEEDEQPELLHAVLQGVGDGLQAGGVARQLENSGQLEDLEDLQDVLQATLVLVLHLSRNSSSGEKIVGPVSAAFITRTWT